MDLHFVAVYYSHFLKRWGKIIFIVKFFPYPGNLRFGRGRSKTQFLGYPFLIPYISRQGPVPCLNIKSQVYFCPNFLLLALKS